MQEAIDTKSHWEGVYSRQSPDSVSWFQEHADESLRLIAMTGLGSSANVIDVGGGASKLVDDLLIRGYTDITVLDLSSAAIVTSQQRLGKSADNVVWLVGDIRAVTLEYQQFDIWHDRAVFHFLTDAASRKRYVEQVKHAVRPGGHVIVATFAENGPLQCSGLPVMRYSADELHAEFGAGFELRAQHKEEHRTPSGRTQHFVYCYCRVE